MTLRGSGQAQELVHPPVVLAMRRLVQFTENWTNLGCSEFPPDLILNRPDRQLTFGAFWGMMVASITSLVPTGALQRTKGAKQCFSE